MRELITPEVVARVDIGIVSACACIVVGPVVVLAVEAFGFVVGWVAHRMGLL